MEVLGKIQGSIDNQLTIGSIYSNTEFGVFGQTNNVSSLNLDYSNEMEVSLRSEVSLGYATILCDLDNTGSKEYEIEITKIYIDNYSDNKSIMIKITDEELLEKTGGIIQGMSGSPIIQNNKFIGAVTHVLVNDATQGFGVFGDMMIKASKEIN